MARRNFACLWTLPLFSLFSVDAIAEGCYESSIVSPSPFMGNNEAIFKLADGSLWEVKYEYEYLYEHYPSVVICPNRGRLIVGEKSLNVQLVAAASDSREAVSSPDEWENFEEANLEGSISGTVQQGRIFKTISGSIYEVTGLTLQLVLELRARDKTSRSGQACALSFSSVFMNKYADLHQVTRQVILARRLSPVVTVSRNGETYKLIVEGFDEPLICGKLK